MKPFALHRLKNDKQLSSIPHFSSSKFLAGGTNLVDLMKYQIEEPEQLIDLSAWHDANYINETDTAYEIGAMVTNTELANFAYSRSDLSLLSQALLSGATVQLRNRATTGGNLLQRTRCYYFYDTAKSCNKREPGSGCAAMEGYNRNHAILGTSKHCIASHPSDMAVAMTALDATVHTRNRAGEVRAIPVRNLYQLPEDTPEQETCLQEDELIVAVTIPKKERGVHLYRKVRDRSSYAFALVSVACTLQMDDHAIASISLAFGGVGVKPWHAIKAEGLLQGNTLSDDLLEQAAQAEIADATGFGHNDFKIPLLVNTMKNVVSTLAQFQQDHPTHQGAMYGQR
ncbi:xanthine dehydrogenase family protein subunit M [Alteromonas pelagimontana]|uniref:Xanthine dehydrogenase family protein subunit M n=1 Tax=Alteromonas pelagimontana TaxID=1858656 RepID=A0A6M4MDE1_9ALTE|nr:xanthine dehydrogenase family protein subunit M [Alteromonas pelagimontana]QJR81214.1 xanthine dehydrogenase family protein subunit M [Alteromonas pelagimontana]